MTATTNHVLNPTPCCFTSHWWELYSGLMFPRTQRGAGKPTTKTTARVAALKRILKNEPWDNHGSNGLRYYQMVVRDGKTLKRNYRSAIDHELCKWKMVGKHGFPERLRNRIMKEMGKRMVMSALPTNTWHDKELTQPAHAPCHIS